MQKPLALFPLALLLLAMLAFAFAARAAEGSFDVTAKLQAAVRDNALTLPVTNALFGDPEPGQAKKLTVDYKLGTTAGRKTVPENGTLELKGAADQPLTILKATYGITPEPELRRDGKPLEPMRFGQTTQFRPAAKWLDDTGVHISGHGGGILFYEGIYYWYGENRTPGKDRGVRCYSSRNLYDWKNEGIVLVATDFAHTLFKEQSLVERPKVLFNRKTKKFVMWFHSEPKGGYGSAEVGVATGDSATGPFTLIESFKPNGQDSRDQTLFLDDDGTAYHLCASEGNATLHITPLTDDFLKPAGPFTRAFQGRSFEAPAVFKRNGKYYLFASGCTGWAPNAGRSAVADSILGPWKELGNPWRGPEDQTKISFNSQSTYVLPVQGKADAFIFMADRWNPARLHDSRFIWVPVEWEGEKPVLHWVDEWSLDIFKK